MKTWLRARPRGMLGFGVITVLVLGGLGWASTAALRLEQDHHAAQAQADHAEKRQTQQREGDQKHQAALREHEQKRQARERDWRQQKADAEEKFTFNLRLAMWRLDSRIARVLAREDARPYHHYSAVYAPSVALDAWGQCLPHGAVVEPSPLLGGDLPDWMLLHFQTAVETGWGSPQVVPVDFQKLLTKNRINFTNVTRQRIQLLSELSSIDTAKSLVQGIERQELQFAFSNNELVANPANFQGGQRNPDGPQPPGNKDAQGGFQQPGLNQLVKQMQPGQQQGQPMYNYGLEYPWRIQQRNSINNEAQKNSNYFNMDEDARILIANTSNLKTWSLPGSGPKSPSANQVMVSLSPMTPLWLTTEDQERLVVARLLRISYRAEEQLALLAAWPMESRPLTMLALGTHELQRSKAKQPRLVCQGIVLDWPGLANLLAAEVRDLFPKAKMLPMRAEIPTHPERTMTVLPVELDPGEAPAIPPLPKEVPAPVEPAPVEPAPATAAELGVTPLRIGLALAWAAALVALTAVGLGGWSLLDLSERRIRFVSAVTHELRTPLTTLRLYLDMLTGGLVQSEEQRDQYLHTLHAETDRLTRLVGNVLDFSRLENQQPRLELSPVRVVDLLDQVQATWQTRCTDTEKVLEMDNALGDRTVVTDVNLVQQIVGNLIDNACKYSRGADDPHLWVRAKLGDAGRVRIEVEDRGPGVKAAERKAIFKPFCRGRDSDVIAGGVGLGLALAQRWAELLGGRLMLEVPAGGVGACFVLELVAGVD